MEIKYDVLNLNNGGVIMTHEKHEETENRSHLTFTTYDSFKVDHNWFLI